MRPLAKLGTLSVGLGLGLVLHVAGVLPSPGAPRKPWEWVVGVLLIGLGGVLWRTADRRAGGSVSRRRRD